MKAQLLSGKVVAEAIKAEVKLRTDELLRDYKFSPRLVVIRVGDDPASAVYVNSKVKTSSELGMLSEHHYLPADTAHQVLQDLVVELNNRPDVDGILVQLPLPRQIDTNLILETIDPAKDVDGFNPINVGRLAQGENSLVPCTPAGVIQILKMSNIPIAGQNAVIVGRSNIVGKPMAMLLLKENATVTICHSHTKNLAEITRQADILVAAIGQPGFVRSEHIGEAATVVDVGINKITDPNAARELFNGEMLNKRLLSIKERGYTLVGDVNPGEAMEKAAHFTPVPGGVGLLTVAMLMKNTVDAAVARRKIIL